MGLVYRIREMRSPKVISHRSIPYMARNNFPDTVPAEIAEDPTHERTSPLQSALKRRSFLKGLGVVGTAVSAGSLLTTILEAQDSKGIITIGDVAILRFLAAAEILETDLWQQ